MIIVEPVNGHIGDHFLALCIAEGLRQTDPDTRFRCAHWVAPWVRLFWPNDKIMLRQFDRRHARYRHPEFRGARHLLLCHDDRHRDVYTAAKQSRWEYWQHRFEVQAKIPTLKVARLFAAPGQLVLCPFANYPDRQWPIEKWLELESRLGQSAVILFGGEDKPHANRDLLWRFTGLQIVDESPETIAALMVQSRCVIACDSGMAHLAGMLGARCAVPCSETSDYNIMGLWPTVAAFGGRDRGGLDAVSVPDLLHFVESK